MSLCVENKRAHQKMFALSRVGARAGDFIFGQVKEDCTKQKQRTMSRSDAECEDEDVVLVPIEWSDGKGEQWRVSSESPFFDIEGRPGAKLTRVGAELGRATWLTELRLAEH